MGKPFERDLADDRDRRRRGASPRPRSRRRWRPTITPRTSSRTSLDVPGVFLPTKLAPAVPLVCDIDRAHEIPAASADASVCPTAATCGSVKITRGESWNRRRAARRSCPGSRRRRAGPGTCPCGSAAHGRSRPRSRRASRGGASAGSSRPRPACPARGRPSRARARRSFRRRPTATSISSPRTLGPSSSSTTTSSPSRETPTARLPVRTSTPAAPSAAATCSEANGSSRTITRGAPSSSTTRVPSDDQACASSTPTTPAPRMTRLSGGSFAVVASRLLHGRASARPGDRRHRRPAAGCDDDRLPRHEDIVTDRGRAARRRIARGRGRP